MGVPKFFRWISERYPRINQPLGGSLPLDLQVPPIDHLYFDLNGIIHLCSHHNDNSALSLKMADEQIFQNIEGYVDLIVKDIVRPKESIVIAVDGVAPRAKLNHQRGRRFVSARERMVSMTAKDDDKTLDFSEEHVFDSNCITPGTEFMAKLDEFLQNMIARKLGYSSIGDVESQSLDDSSMVGLSSSAWGPIKVVYSGHSVPGEGEHKIMQHIRHSRSHPKYKPNQRHCIYGQDADLLMLGLATHEPHFTILREVVNFKRNSSSNNNFKLMEPSPLSDDSDDSDDDNSDDDEDDIEDSIDEVEDDSLPLGLPPVEFVLPEPNNFQLLHLSVLREYIEVEFVHKHWGAALDRERLIDDFIFMTFLVGNDFLPHLPALNIGENAFDVIFDAYKALQSEKVGYFVLDGEICDFDRLEEFFMRLSCNESNILEKRALRSKLRGQEKVSKEQKSAIMKVLSALDSAEKESTSLYDNDYQQKYYLEKFGGHLPPVESAEFLPSSEEFVGSLVTEYIRGLMWCYAYYSKGCPSWEWFFPHHYGPMLKDMVGIRNKMQGVRFELGEPLLPFQQLLGCLPPNSAHLLPAPYRGIMTSESSPLKSFYPLEFQEDLNGKKNAWEAVVLLPFLDVDKLKLVVQAIECDGLSQRLSEADRMRNQFGSTITYLPKQLSEESVQYGLQRSAPVTHPSKSFSSRLVQGTVIPHEDFPSLRGLSIKFIYVRLLHEKALVGMKYKTLILGLDRSQGGQYDPQSSKSLIGKHVYINYPMKHEAKVVGVATRSFETAQRDRISSEVVVTTRDEESESVWVQLANKMRYSYFSGQIFAVGSGTGGLDIGEIDTILTVLPVVKAKPLNGNVVERSYADTPAFYPLQMVQFPQSTVKRRSANAAVGRFAMRKRNFSTHCLYSTSRGMHSIRPFSVSSFGPVGASHLRKFLRIVL